MASHERNSSFSARGLLGSGRFADLQQEMNRVFDDVVRSFRGIAPGVRAMSPLRLDVCESENELCVVADIPGVAPSDLDVRIDGNALTVSAERRSDGVQQQHNYHLMERTHGFVRRTVQLPFAPDPAQVRARYENGVLTLRMPKNGSQQGGRRIEVHGSGGQSAAAGFSDDDVGRARASGQEGSARFESSARSGWPGTMAAGAV